MRGVWTGEIGRFPPKTCTCARFYRLTTQKDVTLYLPGFLFFCFCSPMKFAWKRKTTIVVQLLSDTSERDTYAFVSTGVGGRLLSRPSLLINCYKTVSTAARTVVVQINTRGTPAVCLIKTRNNPYGRPLKRCRARRRRRRFSSTGGRAALLSCTRDRRLYKPEPRTSYL